MTWGTGPYGTGSWGALSTDLTVVSAEAIATNTVRVALSGEPQHQSEFLTGDALNPDTWEVSYLDTGEKMIVTAVVEYDPPLEFDISVLEPFRSFNVQHRILSTSLLSVIGNPLQMPNSADFCGVIDADLSTTERKIARRKIAIRDLVNRPTPSSNSLGGTLQISSGGDYVLTEGEELIKKLIIRRLTTPRGAFFHLPDYGIGLAVKEQLRAANLIGLQKETERQVELEPEVDSARVQLAFTTGGILTVQMQIKLKPTGQTVNIPLEFPASQVVL